MIEDIFNLTKPGKWDWFYDPDYLLPFYLDQCDNIPDDLPVLNLTLGGMDLMYGPQHYMARHDGLCYLSFVKASDNSTREWTLGQDFLSSNRMVFNYDNGTIGFEVPIPAEPEDDGTESKSGLSVGAIVGIVIAGVVVVTGGIVCYCKKRKPTRRYTELNEND